MKQYDYYKAAFRAGKTVLPPKKNWFPTLNAALTSERLVPLWPLGSNIQYDQTVQHTVETARGRHRLISVYRNEFGAYERPITYLTD